MSEDIQTHVIMCNNVVVVSVTGPERYVAERMATEREAYYRENNRSDGDEWHVVSVPL